MIMFDLPRKIFHVVMPYFAVVAAEATDLIDACGASSFDVVESDPSAS